MAASVTTNKKLKEKASLKVLLHFTPLCCRPSLIASTRYPVCSTVVPSFLWHQLLVSSGGPESSSYYSDFFFLFTPHALRFFPRIYKQQSPENIWENDKAQEPAQGSIHRVIK